MQPLALDRLETANRKLGAIAGILFEVGEIQLDEIAFRSVEEHIGGESTEALLRLRLVEGSGNLLEAVDEHANHAGLLELGVIGLAPGDMTGELHAALRRTVHR